jgi:hypothetical protein
VQRRGDALRPATIDKPAPPLPHPPPKGGIVEQA